MHVIIVRVMRTLGLLIIPNELRNREYIRLNPLEGIDFTEANRRFSDPRTNPEEKERLRPKLRVVKDLFPQKLSEAEPSKK